MSNILKELAIRYRKGTLKYVSLNVIEQFRENADISLRDFAERKDRAKQILDGSGWGIAIESTWVQLLSEIVQEFERTNQRGDQSWRPILADYVRLITEDRPVKDLWDDVKKFLYKNIDVLSGWNWSARKSISSHQVYYRDGQYFYKDGDEEIQIFGIRTDIEERVDFIADSLTMKHRPLNILMKAFALTNIERLARVAPEEFPPSVKLYLGEGDSGTWFLNWEWDLKWPYQMRPVNWRPNDNHCDPVWLANDQLVFVSEADHLEVASEHLNATPNLAAKWQDTFGGSTRQMSFALESNLRLGSEDEAWFNFRGHIYRWVNQTSASYPALIATHLTEESERDVTLRAFKVLSHIAFKLDDRIDIEFWVGTHSGLNPGVSNSKRKTTVQFPADYFHEVSGNNADTLDFALSLYREGVSSGSKFYGFLNFYKIVQIPFSDTTKFNNWIAENAPRMRPFDDKYFKNDLAESKMTIADYLRTANRNAITHVNLQSGQPVVNPDEIEDLHRVSNSLNLVRDLARFAIREKMF